MFVSRWFSSFFAFNQSVSESYCLFSCLSTILSVSLPYRLVASEPFSSISQSASKLVSQSISQSGSKSVSQSVSQPVCHYVTLSFSLSARQHLVIRSVSNSVRKIIHQSWVLSPSGRSTVMLMISQPVSQLVI